MTLPVTEFHTPRVRHAAWCREVFGGGGESPPFRGPRAIISWEGHVLEDLDKPVAEIQGEASSAPESRRRGGVGVGRRIQAGRDTGEPCLSVFVTKERSWRKRCRKSRRIPRTIKHCTTDVVAIGEVRGDEDPLGIPAAEPQSERASFGRGRL